LRIVDEEGHVLPANSRGELQVRGASVAQVYWRRSDARDEAFDGDWFRTGDVAYMDDEGFLFIVDRIKDVVIRGGENIGCGAVEAALLDYEGVVEAVVYGIPDERLGERVGATIRTIGEIDVAVLKKFLAGRLAPFQVPERVRTVKTALPRTASGKMLRREAREQALAAIFEEETAIST
jgi:long-chain acyl-CoA synthetase